jgi:hypothetical protein
MDADTVRALLIILDHVDLDRQATKFPMRGTPF